CLDGDDEQRQNIVTATLRPGLRFDVGRIERNFYTSSSCSICGKASIEALEVQGCTPCHPATRSMPRCCVRRPRCCARRRTCSSTRAGCTPPGSLASTESWRA